MKTEQYSSESLSEISCKDIDTSFYPFGLYHLIREGQREHISFEKLRSIVVPWAKRALQENGGIISEGDKLFNREGPENELTDTAS